MKLFRLLTFILLSILCIHCSCKNSHIAHSVDSSSIAADSMILYFCNPRFIERFMDTGPSLLLQNVERFSYWDCLEFSQKDSIVIHRIISLLDNTETDPNKVYIPRERSYKKRIMPLTPDDDSLLVNSYEYHGIDTYYIIVTILQGRRDTTALGRFSMNGVYRASQGYLVKDNGLFQAIMDIIGTAKPGWEDRSSFSVH